MNRTLTLWYGASAVVLLVDQCTKWMAQAWLFPHEPMPLLPFFGWFLTYNTGAAFSFLRDAGGWQRWFFLSIGLAMSVWLTVWLWTLARTPIISRLLPAGLILILGGALGNLIDRALFGHVVDFIHVYYGTWHFPAFNMADTAITIGAGLLILDSLFPSRTTPIPSPP